MRELPRKLTVDELAELFEGRTRFVELLADLDDPLQRAEDLLVSIGYEDKLEALNAHPVIGQRAGLSARSAAEQGADADAAVLDELERLNVAYEDRFGFRFVVFVNGRPKAEVSEVLRERIENTREDELDTACRELVAIARDRWTRT
jgi:2-oxo-4-hydroxy-4-carboxy--5-ureidoimidazoline (OHCU) decarboxylase